MVKVPEPKDAAVTDLSIASKLMFDLIRLARKGWPTLLRIAYLSILLLGLAVMYRSRENLVKPSEFARSAEIYAYILVVLQDVLVLLFLPVYVASAIAQEKENRTLEIVFLSFLTDRELVLGKLAPPTRFHQ